MAFSRITGEKWQRKSEEVLDRIEESREKPLSVLERILWAIGAALISISYKD